MEINTKKNYFKGVVAVLLIIALSLPLFFGCSLNLFGNNASVEESTDLVTLQLVSTSETTAEAMTWTEVANKVIPSIVAIVSYDGSTGSSSTGSGIIISSNGYIITNAHVIDSETNTLTVILNDNTPSTASDNARYTATLIGMDEYTDLAVIKIDATDLTPAEFGNSDELQIAEGVMAVGYPGGLDLSPSATVTIGYVSATNRPIDMGDGYVINSIQTDAAINPGNSGGALVNVYGQVVGIPSSKIAATEYEGLGFAIPSTVAQTIVNDLIEYGYVTNRATIGVGGVLYNEYYAAYYHTIAGLHVQNIYATLTANAGLQVGDIITEIEGNSVSTINVINGVLQTKVPGDTISMQVYRNSSYLTLTVTLSDFHDVYGTTN
ncbi:MAG: S1C family serine protease [Spirochaetales bacterium]